MLNTDGPHSPDNTADLAGLVSEALRVLNYATSTDAGVKYPGTVYTVLGRLYSATGGFGQLARQLDGFLRSELEAGRLGVDGGGDVSDAVASAHEAFVLVDRHAAALTRALQDAQSAISAVHHQGG